MSFKLTYEQWLESHSARRKGERLRRLEEGHGHAERTFAEQVWWPAFGQFHDLHPEYEVSDFRDGRRYLDFALIRGRHRLAMEIDGYGPHLQRISRTQFADQCMRQNHLILDGWKILRFSYDDVAEKPRMCQSLLSQYMGRWFGGTGMHAAKLTSEEKDILRFALQQNEPLQVKEICSLLGVEQQKARKLLKQLLALGYLHAYGQSSPKRIARYEAASGISLDDLGF
ncbi:DNA-binding response regulator [Paenibacillus sp. S-38]|uniref:DNA-binding response regulator n=1 Tax=Paenibacillus sp. S-38 TaxID=3416710 RepID=UPI003CE67FF9